MQGAVGQTFSMNQAFATEYLPFVVYTVAAVLLVSIIHVAAWWLGTKTTCANKEMPYESGIIPTGSARFAYPVPFYLVAIFFIVFDVETVFIISWAVAWDVLGLPGLIHITAFIIVLLLGLAWLWIKGGLEWGPLKQKQNAESGARNAE